MALETPLDERTIEQLFAEARADLVRWCTSFVGNRDSAEDMVQETLSIAWRSTRRPPHVSEFQAWLMGIARNVCLMWLRSQRRELAHRLDSSNPWHSTQPNALHFEPKDSLDLEMLLEQEALARLIEKGLAVLPDATRRVLIAKYIEEYSLVEIAEQFQVTPEAVAARLQRGKQTLRQVLMRASPEERSLYGMLAAESEAWQTTPIWCPDCGRHRLQGRLEEVEGSFTLRCFFCFKRTQTDFAHWEDRDLFHGLKTFRAALTRLTRYGHTYYRQGLASQIALCQRCGKAAVVRFVREGETVDVIFNAPFVLVDCPHCHRRAFIDVDGLVLCHPVVQSFWRQQKRIVTYPQQRVDAAGRPAILSRFVNVRGTQQIAVVSDGETLEILSISEGVAHD